jgi:phage/plasmid-associated DNA primase
MPVPKHETADAGMLYDVFKEWSEKNGEETLTQRKFGTQRRERGFEAAKKRGHRCWVGLRFRRETDDD